jgi:hypothetical protein
VRIEREAKSALFWAVHLWSFSGASQLSIFDFLSASRRFHARVDETTRSGQEDLQRDHENQRKAKMSYC